MPEEIHEVAGFGGVWSNLCLVRLLVTILITSRSFSPHDHSHLKTILSHDHNDLTIIVTSSSSSVLTSRLSSHPGIYV